MGNRRINRSKWRREERQESAWKRLAHDINNTVARSLILSEQRYKWLQCKLGEVRNIERHTRNYVPLSTEARAMLGG
jgi:hypothetical protein